MKNLRIVIAAAVLLAVGAFAWLWASGRIFAAKLGSAASATSSALVNIGDLTPFQWESVVFFGPYTNASVARDALGFDWPLYKFYGLEGSDSFSLALFLRKGEVVNFATVRRCSPDFAPYALAKKFDRRSAVFRIQAATGCITLMPQQLQSATITAMANDHAF